MEAKQGFNIADTQSDGIFSLLQISNFDQRNKDFDFSFIQANAFNPIEGQPHVQQVCEDSYSIQNSLVQDKVGEMKIQNSDAAKQSSNQIQSISAMKTKSEFLKRKKKLGFYSSHNEENNNENIYAYRRHRKPIKEVANQEQDDYDPDEEVLKKINSNLLKTENAYKLSSLPSQYQKQIEPWIENQIDEEKILNSNYFKLLDNQKQEETKEQVKSTDIYFQSRNELLQYQKYNKIQTFQVLTGGNYDELKDKINRKPVESTSYDGRQYTVLVVAEKPSIAKTIADSLCKQKNYNTRKGECQYTNIYEFFGEIFGRRAFFQITSVMGHIYCTDFPDEYQDWRRNDPFKLFEAPTIQRQVNKDSLIVDHLQKESLGSSFLILWLDNDKEGENICFEVMDICKKNLMKEEFQQIYRAQFSAITPVDIIQSFKNLHCGPNINQSRAVDARQIIDLKIGIALSRFQTRYLTRKFEEINNRKITYGPCQIPTLSFCVDRDDEIQNFVSTQSYSTSIKASNARNGLKYQLKLVKHKVPIRDRELAQQIKSELEFNGQDLQILKVETRDKIKRRTEPLNTTALMQTASQQLGMSPQHTISIAEQLYLSGYITYPRTDNTVYPKDFDFKGVMSALSYCKNQTIVDYSIYLVETSSFNIPTLKEPNEEHPPISPTTKSIEGVLSRDQSILYEIIGCHFLASISSNALFLQRNVVLQCRDHILQIQGYQIINKGYTQILPWIKLQTSELPDINIQDVVKIEQVSISEIISKPPSHLTESELMSRMEKHEIGTDTSMAQHIFNICEREYITVNKDTRQLIPTNLGRALIHGLQAVDPELVAPYLRSQIEQSVLHISEGRIDYELILLEVMELFKIQYLYMVSNMSKLDREFDRYYTSLDKEIQNSIPFSKCGRCKNLLLLLMRSCKLFCNSCQYGYSLPGSNLNGGILNRSQSNKPTFTAVQGVFCPLDGYQIIICERNLKGRVQRFTVCPLCYQKNTEYSDSDEQNKTSCNICQKVECQLSMVNNSIQQCKHCITGPNGRPGQLVLDCPVDEMGPCTMTCNRCSFQIRICSKGQILRFNNKCSQCDSNILKIRMEEYTYRHYRKSDFLGCVFCDQNFAQDLEYLPVQVDRSQENDDIVQYKSYYRELKVSQDYRHNQSILVIEAPAVTQNKTNIYAKKSGYQYNVENLPVHNMNQRHKGSYTIIEVNQINQKAQILNLWLFFSWG